MSPPPTLVSAAVEVPSGPHVAFPPFDRHAFPSQVLWLVLTFVALYFLMSRVAVPRIELILRERRQCVSGDLAEARRLKVESDDAVATSEKALAAARARAQSRLAEISHQQAVETEAHRKSIQADVNARITNAEKAVAEAKLNAMGNVRRIAIEITPAIVERLIGAKPASKEVMTAATTEALKR